MALHHSNAYLSTQVNTDDRVALVIALYEGVLAYLAQAIEAIKANNVEKRREMIRKAADVVMALSDSLDYSQPSSLAGDLFSIYSFQLQQMLEANRKNDVEPLQLVKSSLRILLDGWREAAKSPEAEEIRQADAARLRTDKAAAASAGRVVALAMSA
jgi:flagellar protein FliS